MIFPILSPGKGKPIKGCLRRPLSIYFSFLRTDLCTSFNFSLDFKPGFHCCWFYFGVSEAEAGETCLNDCVLQEENLLPVALGKLKDTCYIKKIKKDKRHLLEIVT